MLFSVYRVQSYTLFPNKNKKKKDFRKTYDRFFPIQNE